MEDFKVNDKISTNNGDIFKIIKEHNKFCNYVDFEEPLLYVYDGNIDKETYIKYSEYKKLNYNYINNISIIERGFFKSKKLLTEEKPRFDIENLYNGEISEGCYLYNGEWKIIN